ncbi:Photosystem I chlorophyll a apoprotein A1 [Capsicum annuum]|uniref:Photosystem I P700 chlorophyll a apoprotein A1 n=1 Tax=Capsicum annuum TaxID=4072 RepID=A0A2G2YFB0_CAPAN|nr:Photosystem I chlorophyll a apoprotein A1 [Capsicum annuum]
MGICYVEGAVDRRLKSQSSGSPSLGRLCPGSGNLSLASSGRLVLACALLQGLRFITPKAFSELLKLSREYQMLTVTKVTDFRWTRSQRVRSNSVTSLRPMEYSQVVRHRFLVPACKGSNPFTPDYEHPIGSVKNELTTTESPFDLEAIAILFLIAGHMYKTNWGIGHGLKDILEAHKGPFTGFHSFGLYIHNDTMSALGRPQDMFSDTAIQLQPVFAQWIQNTHALAPGATAPGATASTSLTWGRLNPKEIPLPHEFILNRDLLAQLYPSFAEGATPFFTLNWSKYADFLTFRGGLDPVTGGLWLTDIAHHHLAISILFLIAGHIYKTNWGIGHGLKDILEAHKGPFTGQGHKGLYEILTTSWHAQLSLNLAMLGSLTIVVAHHMYSMPPYPYLATDYGTQLSLFTHHMWIGGFLIVGAAVHATIFMVRDYDPTTRYNDLLDRVLRHRDAIISHLNWACIFLGFHSFGLYIHNDTMSALGRPQDMFSDTAIQLQPVFAQWIQNTHALAPGATAPGATANTSLTWGGGDLVAVGGKVALLPIPLGTADFLVHHIHAFTIHVTVLILLKGVLFARSSRLIPDKANLGFRFPCDGPGRGGTCQVSAWDHVFLGLFWMYNSISVVIFHFSWKMQSDVWGSVSDQGVVTHITGGNFAQSSITINGWLRDFLWAQASQVIQSYGSSLSAYGLFFLGAHFVWAFSLMFLFSGRGYWQELIESIVWAHNKLKVAPATQPRALSIIQGRAVGVTHYLLGGIATTWAFFLARIIAVG